MSTKITVEFDGKKRVARCPYDGAKHVEVSGVETCPACGTKTNDGILRVSGSRKRIESHDTYAADAWPVCCGKSIGVLRVKVDTIFGIEEDERVLNGRWRVY